MIVQESGSKLLQIICSMIYKTLTKMFADFEVQIKRQLDLHGIFQKIVGFNFLDGHEIKVIQLQQAAYTHLQSHSTKVYRQTRCFFKSPFSLPEKFGPYLTPPFILDAEKEERKKIPSAQHSSSHDIACTAKNMCQLTEIKL